jgi:enolase
LIDDLRGRLILNSRGQLTTEVEVKVGDSWFRSAAPSGASTGSLEAPELDAKEALDTLMAAKPELLKMSEDEIDVYLQENIQKFGRGAVALSFAIFKSKPLEIDQFPYPLGNILGGGKHGGGTDIQEFLISPKKSDNVQDAVFTNAAAHREMKNILKKIDSNFLSSKNDEGGWVCSLSTDKILETLAKLGDEFDVKVGMDLACDSLWDEKQGKYVYKKAGKSYTPEEHVDFVVDLIDTYKLFYVEDGMFESHWDGFVELTKKAGDRCLICGDDIFVTNAEILQKGIQMGACNSLIIKPNQVGTIGAAKITVDLAKSKDYRCIVSHRSGETEDNTLARVALAFKADLIKTGIVGGERIAKLNELIRLWKPGCKMAKL